MTDRNSGSCLNLLFGELQPSAGLLAGYVCRRLEKAPSIIWQQPCPLGCWPSPQTLYLQLAGPGKPCQAPWGKVI